MSLEYQSDQAEDVAQPEELHSIVIPFPYYTYILLLCIGAVFATQYLTSFDPEFALVDRYSIAYAGFDKREFLNGEYWRIFTGTFIHAGLLHVGMNSYALYSLGRLVEVLSNRAHLAIVFVLSALGGALLSLVFNPDVRSVGASGGIIGFLTYLAVYAFKRRKFVSREFRKSLLVNIGFILVFGLVLFRVIDNYAHIGGLVVGTIYGLIQIPRDEYTDPRLALRFTTLLGIFAIGFCIVTALLAIAILINCHSSPCPGLESINM